MIRVVETASKASIALLALLLSAQVGQGGDWSRFRGPNGSGISPDAKPTPIEWSESENLKWKVALPGPGLSSPIVVGDRVYVTCWTGYGTDREDPGQQKDLRRHLICIDRNDGKTIWSKSIEPVLPEEPFRGMFAENGYASQTPVCDGERIFVFFGKTGALAFDLEGKKLWQKGLGTESDPHGWGSASSPILYRDLVIVTASTESEAVIALHKDTGEEVWRQEAAGFSGTWGTPILVELEDGRHDLVIGVPYEIWGLDPANGKLRWYCEGVDSQSMCASVIAHDGVVYAVGGRNGGSIAVRAGGKGDVTKSHVLWTGRDRARIGTPVVVDGRLHWISNRIANCIDAATGEEVYQSRLHGAGPVRADADERQGGRGFGRRGGGGRGGQNYSSPVVADGKMYFVTRAGTAFVLGLGPKFEQLARNRFASDAGEFSATPALSDGELFIRSSKNLYCVAKSD